MANRNTLYSQVLVDELARSGLRHVVISPGSRNTPLVLAFAEHPHIKAYSLLDERGAGFFALGLAMMSGEAVAVVCTSGSALANYFPAVVEARQTRKPLIVITADRPPELRDSGANQTVDQVKLFGTYALWSVDCALPEAQPDDLLLRYLRTTANRAMAIANGNPKGVVHLNVPFRKPLEPTPIPTDRTTLPEDAYPRPLDVPFTQFDPPTITPNSVTLDWLAQMISSYPNGIIVCGANTPLSARASIVMLSSRSAYPIFADSTSGIRFGFKNVVSGYDVFLPFVTPEQIPFPDVVIRFGDLPTSQTLATYLEKARPQYHVHISADNTWADDMHRVSHFIHADEKRLIALLLNRFESRTSTMMQKAWFHLDLVTWETLESAIAPMWFDGAVVYETLKHLPESAHLFVGNSLAVRHLDQFGKHDSSRAITAFANRGASGIDGNLATASGIATADPNLPTVALLGDVTLYHDLNSLLCAPRVGVPMVVVVLNNDGGGIFRRLPIKDYEPTFTDFFITPHGLQFGAIARSFGWEYAHPTTSEVFKQALLEGIRAKKYLLIEVSTDSSSDMLSRQQLLQRVKTRLSAWHYKEETLIED